MNDNSDEHGSNDLHGGAEIGKVYVIHIGTGVHHTICLGGEQWLSTFPCLLELHLRKNIRSPMLSFQ